MKYLVILISALILTSCATHDSKRDLTYGFADALLCVGGNLQHLGWTPTMRGALNRAAIQSNEYNLIEEEIVEAMKDIMRTHELRNSVDQGEGL